MGKEIGFEDHLVNLNPVQREREAIERIMVGVYGRNSADIACYFGVHHYAHTLLVDIPWDAFVSDRENCQGDIDFAIILDAPGNVYKVRKPSCIRNRAHVQIIEYRQGLTG